MATEQTRELLVDSLSRELTPGLLELGLDLEALDVTAAGRRRVLRVAVDKDGGVTLDDVAEATKEVSRVLDSGAALAAWGEQPYTLEVTSPGVDRPLTLPRHWRRNVGRLVKVSTHDGRTVTGRVVGHDDQSATLDVDGGVEQVALADVERARVQVELNPAGKGR